MNDADNFDPFAAPQGPPGTGQPGLVQPIPPPAPQPAPQPGVGYPAMMPAAPYGYGAPPPPSASSGQKNYLGILALIFPFVFLGLVGIVMGHLGLAAVKRGEANNRGVALAGTILSWVFTVGTLVLTAIAIPVFLNQRDKAEELEVRADLAGLNAAVARYVVDRGEIPEVSIDGNHYAVGDSIEFKSPLVEDVDLVVTGDYSYCLAVTYHEDEVWSVTGAGNMVPEDCSGAAPGGNAPAAADDPAPLTGPADGIVDFTALEVGDCIADPYDNLVEDEAGQSWVTGAKVVDCDIAHYGEVYAVVPMQTTTYVEDDIYAEADELCYVRFETYVGTVYEDSSYYYEAYYPSAVGWKLGDHETTCVVTSYASDTVGSVKGSGV